MKRNGKKAAIWGLLLLLGISLLAGCNPGGPGNVSTGADGLPVDDESQPYELDYWIAVEAATIPKDLSLVEAAINEITQEKINATVTLHAVVVGDYESRMQLTVNAGDKFDLCFTSPWLNKYSRLVELEGLYDITDLLPQYAPHTWEMYDEKIWAAARIDGRIYGSINRQIMARTAGVSLDKAMYEASGMTEEDFATPDGMTRFLAYCADHGADMTNLTQGWDPQGLMALLQFNDLYGANTPGVIDVSSGEMTVFNQFESQKFRDALAYSIDWYQKGYIHPDVLTTSFDFSKSYGIYMATWKPSGAGEDTVRRGGRESVCIPVGPSINYSNWVASTMTAVSATSENPVRAVKFIELLNTDPQLYNLICYGIEGRHYTKLDDTHIELIPDSGYSINAAWEFGDQFQSYLLPGYPEDVWEQTDRINQSAVFSPAVGFTFDPSPVRVEITNCQAVYTEFWYPLVSGVYGDQTYERLDVFISRLKESGSDKIIEEMQRQLDAWQASQ